MLQAPVVLPPAGAPAVASRRPRRSRRLLAVAAAALVLTGCATSHEPKDYNADMEKNFLDACTKANDNTKGMSDATQFCECVWKAVRENFSYDEFKTLDKTIRERVGDENNRPQNAKDIEAINSEYVKLVDGCRTAGPAPTN